MIPVVIIAAIVAVFLAIILIRAALFVPKDEPQPATEAVDRKQCLINVQHRKKFHNVIQKTEF